MSHNLPQITFIKSVLYPWGCTMYVSGGIVAFKGNRKQGSLEIALGGHAFENSQISPGPFFALRDRNLRCLYVFFLQIMRT